MDLIQFLKRIIKYITSTTVLVVLALLLTGCGTNRFEPHGWSGITLDNNKIFIGSGDGQLIILGAEGGNLIQTHPQNKENLHPIYSAPLLSNNGKTIFYGTYSKNDGGTIYSLQSGTLSPNWTKTFPGSIVGQPVLGNNLLIVSSSDGKLYAMEPETGTPKWVFQSDGKLWSSAALSEENSVFIGSLNKKFYAINLENGAKLWEFETDGAIVGTPLVNDSTVYFGTLNKTIHALDTKTGSEKWSRIGDHWYWAPLSLDNNVLYAGSMGGTVSALNLNTGLPLWEANVNGAILAPMLTLESLIVIATDEGQVTVLRKDSGLQTWDFPAGDSIRAKMANQGSRIYLITTEGEIKSLDAERGTSLWSRQRED
ncbi:MAG: hypothetical protein CL785_01420 [Chloroflexi bacterium]|nr:hypothetical protein [Chloroflexota bacterium]